MLALLVGRDHGRSRGIARLGFVADLLSKPTMIGYMNGLALTILVGQLPKLFGFSVDADGFIDELTGFVKGVADGETVPRRARGRSARPRRRSSCCSGCCRRSRRVLVAVVLSIVAAALFDLGEHGVDARRRRCRRASRR